MAQFLTDASVRAAITRADVAGRVEDFESTCLTGTPAEISQAYDVVLRATGKMLEQLHIQAEAILKFWGMDPATRPQ